MLKFIFSGIILVLLVSASGSGQSGLPPVLPSQTPPPPPPPRRLEALPNTLEKALETAKVVVAHFQPGRIWQMRAPAGEIELKGGLVYQNTVVAVVRFSPVDGSVLPMGYNPWTTQTGVDLTKLHQYFSEVVPKIRVLEGAEFREPELCWAFPLVYEGKIVGHIKIYYDGIHVVPDYPAQQEMQLYGR